MPCTDWAVRWEQCLQVCMSCWPVSSFLLLLGSFLCLWIHLVVIFNLLDVPTAIVRHSLLPYEWFIAHNIVIFFPSDSSIIKGGIKSGIILQVKMPHNTVDKERDGLDFYFFFLKQWWRISMLSLLDSTSLKSFKILFHSVNPTFSYL